jgi:hypothetical protein
MIQKRKGAFIRKVKDITLSSTLSLGLLGTTLLMPGCDNTNSSADNNTEEYEVSFTKGMQTHIQETEKGIFKITEEQVVGEGESKAIVTFLNGQTDTLSLDAAKRIVEADKNAGNWDENTNQEVRQGYHGGGLSSVLMYGALGYYMGRSMNSRPNPGFYANPSVYNRAQQHTSTIQQSARVNRPVNSSKGYFKGGSNRSVGA